MSTLYYRFIYTYSAVGQKKMMMKKKKYITETGWNFLCKHEALGCGYKVPVMQFGVLTIIKSENTVEL